MKNPLWGDGIHDDTAAIQALLDSGKRCIALPLPKTCYLISKTLKIHSFQEFKLDRYAEIRLALGSNCPMLTNDDPENGNGSISIRGGIWNGNNLQQAPNPQMVVASENLPVPETVAVYLQNRSELPPAGGVRKRLLMPEGYPIDPLLGVRTPTLEPMSYHPDRYWGVLMRFVNVDRFSMEEVTLRDPVTYGIQCGRVSNFTFRAITFDYNEGNPSPNNMDGLHFDGFCRNGYISDLKGACYDDLLAFNADDGTCDSPGFGPIENIVVDGIFADRCHSAARLLSTGSPIRNITIRNVHGSFYRYAIGLTHFFPERPLRGSFDGLTFENLHISKALPLESDWNICPDWGLIWGEGGGTIGTMKITGMHRVENTTATPCVELGSDIQIGTLTIEDSAVENLLPEPLTLLQNAGVIEHLTLRNNRLVSNPTGRGVKMLFDTGKIIDKQVL